MLKPRKVSQALSKPNITTARGIEVSGTSLKANRKAHALIGAIQESLARIQANPTLAPDAPGAAAILSQAATNINTQNGGFTVLPGRSACGFADCGSYGRDGLRCSGSYGGAGGGSGSGGGGGGHAWVSLSGQTLHAMIPTIVTDISVKAISESAYTRPYALR